MEVAIATLNCATRQQRAGDIQRVIYAATAAFSRPDIVVFGAQEVAPVMQTLLGTTNAYKIPIYKGIESALETKYPQTTYRLAVDHWAGGIGVIVYTRLSFQAAQSSSTSFGNFWSSAKAAVGARLTVGGATYTFVSTHLPAHQGRQYIEQRNGAYKILANGLRFGSGESAGRAGSGDSIYDTNHLFVLGDLNYRATLAREEAQSLLSDFDFGQNDELTVEKQQGNILWGLEESPIQFEPTFKYYLDSQSFNHKRTPAWTDRIFYSDSNSAVKDYSSLQEYTTSDHRPVYLSIVVQPSHRMPSIVVPSTAVFPQNLSWAVDRVLGSGIFLGTTKIGWGILVLAAISLFLLF